MFQSLLDELQNWKMDETWVCSYCELGAADDPTLSKFVCVRCAEEFVFCAECFFDTHRKFMGDDDEKIQRAAAERQSTNLTRLRRKKMAEQEKEEKEEMMKKEKEREEMKKIEEEEKKAEVKNIQPLKEKTNYQSPPRALAPLRIEVNNKPFAALNDTPPSPTLSSSPPSTTSSASSSLTSPLPRFSISPKEPFHSGSEQPRIGT